MYRGFAPVWEQFSCRLSSERLAHTCGRSQFLLVCFVAHLINFKFGGRLPKVLARYLKTKARVQQVPPGN